MSQRVRAEGVPMREFRATTQNFGPAIIEMDAAMHSGRLQHDGNPVLEWCVGNVVGKADRRGNLYPTKQRPDQKIDAAVALTMRRQASMVFSQIPSSLDLMEYRRAGEIPRKGACAMRTDATLTVSDLHGRTRWEILGWRSGMICRSKSCAV